jgi:hypothetical protein
METELLGKRSHPCRGRNSNPYPECGHDMPVAAVHGRPTAKRPEARPQHGDKALFVPCQLIFSVEKLRR